MSLIGLPMGIEELIASALIVFVISLIYKFLINQNEIKELKSNMKEKQAKMKETQKTNPEEANRVMSEVLALSNKQMRMSMKPMFLTLILVGIALPWFAQVFGGIVIKLPFYSQLFKSLFGWLVGSGGIIKPWLAWYTLVSIPLGQIFRKLIGAEL